MAARFAAEPDLGLIQPRVVDPTGIPAPRRWTPRLRVGDPGRSSDVTAVWEGAVSVRREVFEAATGWPDEFFYAHEGIELAWRVWDCGYRVAYDGTISVNHPVIQPTRHAGYYRLSGRNRVWLARRNLPVPLGALYVLIWFVLTAARLRSGRAAIEVCRGYWDGLREPCGARRRMHWRTVWRMARAGRPPVI
jgi:GT2 family glycosyltransferase